MSVFMTGNMNYTNQSDIKSHVHTEHIEEKSKNMVKWFSWGYNY